MSQKNQNPDTHINAIGYVRTITGLEKLSCRTLHSFHVSSENRNQTLAEQEPFVALERTPMQTPSGDPQVKALLTAWNILAAVRVPTHEAAAALQTVLTQTVPAAQIPAPRPYPFTALAAPGPIKPTAAHPRAFRGTTYQPPKDKAPIATDLRPYLCDRSAIQDLLGRFLPFDNLYTGQIHGAFHHPLTPDLTPVFIANIFPALRNKSPESAAAAHALFQQLGLERNAPLLACIAALYARSSFAPAWGEMITFLSPDQQAAFAGLLLETNACDIDPAVLPQDFVEIVLEIANGPQEAYRMYCLLQGATRGVLSGYLRQGFRWSDLLNIDRRFHDIHDSGGVPTNAINSIIDLAIQEDAFSFDARWQIMDAWEACGVLEGLAAFIENRGWSRWRASTALSLLHLYSDSADHENPAEARMKWRSTCASADKIEWTLERIPLEYQWKFLKSLREFIWRTELEDWGTNSIGDACILLERLGRPPFHPHRDIAYVWVDFISYFDKEQRELLLTAPDISYQQMEKNCRTNNTANQISRGNWAIAKIMPAFTLGCFLHAPSRLFRTAKTLGCLSSAERLEMAQAFSHEPFMRRNLEEMNDTDVYTFIAAQENSNLTKAIPKELRSHYDGVRVLNAPRLAHHHALMRRQWLRICLEALENKIYDRLSRGLPIDGMDDDVRHALQMQMVADENRKPLKKLLTAHWGGRSNYLLDHPLTREWLKKHPALNLNLWLSGVPYTQSIAPWGEVAITLEQDPIEALKLGTYVGSCLGLGGICAYSAAATVLDINKQVLYARDAKGTVVGRQVVGYDEAGKLVAFPVYPHSAPAAIRTLFAAYDRKFALALGVPVVKAGDGVEYEVAFIVSNTWWNDDLDLHGYDKPKNAERSLTPSP